MLLEAVGNQIKIDPLTGEYQWIGSLQPTKFQKDSSKPFTKPKWKMRLLEKEFSEWWQRQNKVSVFFDGASKGNLGIAKAWSLLYYPGGMLETSFSWGIGQSTNNQA